MKIINNADLYQETTYPLLKNILLEDVDKHVLKDIRKKETRRSKRLCNEIRQIHTNASSKLHEGHTLISLI